MYVVMLCSHAAKQVTELHKKLVYVNEHQKCELRQSHEQLEQCRRELLEARVTVNAERERIQTVGDSVKTKANSHELRMVCVHNGCTPPIILLMFVRL